MNNFEAVVLLSPEISSNVRSSSLDNLKKIINEKSGKIINNEDDLEINVGSFERGLYFISISSGENTDNLKFLIK